MHHQQNGYQIFLPNLRNIGWLNALDNLESSHCKIKTNGLTVSSYDTEEIQIQDPEELNFMIFNSHFGSWFTTNIKDLRHTQGIFGLKLANTTM